MRYAHKYTSFWQTQASFCSGCTKKSYFHQLIYDRWHLFVSFSLHRSSCLQISNEKRASAEMMKPKPKPQKKKKKKDPNEPQKPVSAYALFFRDTQAAIKGQNPNATFGDVSKIVASMWDSLGEEQKQVQNTGGVKYLKQWSGWGNTQESVICMVKNVFFRPSY